MFRPYKLMIPKNRSEIIEKLGGMMLLYPTFEDVTGYFPGMNIENTFQELNEGLRLLQPKLGEEMYLKLREMSDQMRAHFEGQTDFRTVESLKGRDVLVQMRDLLKQSRRRRS